MSAGLNALVWTLAAAAAQGAAPEPRAASERLWTLSVGHESISTRDISRTRMPVETSPVGLEGRGVAVRARYERATVSRAHVLQVAASPSFSRFALVSPVHREPAPGSRASSLQARYEYRWYPFRDVAVRGIDFGVGGLAHAAREIVERRIAPANDIRTSDLEGGGGASLNARVRRWSRVRLDALLAGLLVMGTTREEHAIDRASAVTQSAGGWRIETSVTAGARISGRLWITGSYAGTGQIRYSSHRRNSERRHQFTIGVTHGR